MRRFKHRIKRFLGWDLPKRRLDLRFELSPPNRRGAKPNISNGSLSRSHIQWKNKPEQFLSALLKDLKAMNARKISAGKRLSKTSIALKWYYPVAVECIFRYAKKAGIPEDPDRQSRLDRVSDVARALATSYKIIFQHDYDGSRFSYAQNRDRVYTCAFRMMELIKLEQRCRGLRYQTLPPRAWQDANTVFHVMLAYENVDFPVPILDSVLRDTSVVRSTSLHDLYTAIQSFALLDHTTWPAEQHVFIDNYREGIDKAVSAHVDSGGDAERDCLLAHCYQSGPPLKQRRDDLSGPVATINCRILAKSVRRDYRDLIRAKAQNNRFLVPRALDALSDSYQLAIGNLMYRNIERGIWSGEVTQIGDPMHDLHIYVGFKEIYLHLRGIFAPDELFRDRRKLADTLANRSAMFGEDQTADRKSLWHVLFSDKKLLRLKTQESRFTTPLRIGSLVAYGMGETDRQRPRLGAISRIFRPEPGSVIIEMDRLASYAEPVKIRKNLDDHALIESQKPLLAFLIFDRNYGWGLLLPRQNLLWENSPVAMLRNDETLCFELDRARTLTRDFFLFGMPNSVRGLGEPDYPEAEAPPPATQIDPNGEVLHLH